MPLSLLLLLAAVPVGSAPPTDPGELRRLAASYAAVEDPRATETYERAIAAAPGDFPLRVEFAEFLWHSGARERGNAQMDRVILLAPANPKLRAHYGVNLAEQGKYVAAAEQLEAARRGGFDGADVLSTWRVLCETGRLDERRVAPAGALPGPNKVPRATAGSAHLPGNPPGRVTELSRAAELEPTSVEVQLDLGRALEATGEAAKAEAAYRRALEIQPDVPLTHYLLGTLLARGGRRDEGARHVALYRRAFDEEQRTGTGPDRARRSSTWAGRA